ncbi:MAG TPA: SDR family oxidoreductase [Nanoarchaeota archaeon]|nr:SDR family oxidoreductase [Nanoarchaeota archaeon]
MEKRVKEDLKELKERCKIFKEKIKGKRFLITGGAGFIGSWLCDILYEFGAEIVCIDNFSTGSKKNISHLIDKQRFTLLENDVSKNDWLLLPEIKERFDFVLHLAARADPKNYVKYPIDTMLSNSLGTLHTLQIATRDKAIYFFASTSEVYGDPKVHPQHEAYWGNVNPIGIRACYDEAKRFSEALCMAFFREKGIEVKISRIFNTYGPRLNDGRVICTFIKQALMNQPLTVFGNGKQTRSPCYITDMIDGILRTIFLGTSGDVYNIGNPEEITIIELAHLIKTLCNSNSEIVFKPLPQDDPIKRKPDITKAKKELGFTPKIPLKEGLERTINWFREVLKCISL